MSATSWVFNRFRDASENLNLDRTVEVNRRIFWGRMKWIGAILALYFVAMYEFFGLTPDESVAVLPGLLGTLAIQIITVVALLGANFLLFFGPFLLFARMGKETYEPGDASWDTKIEDVRGQKAAVAEMRNLLRLFTSGKNFVKAGGKRERGALLVGPPGTGKTMLAKAIASTLHMPIIVASGASFGGIFFGMDAVAVFAMMRTARKKAKRWGGCCIFIDEIDALASNRGGGTGQSAGIGGMMTGGNSMGLNMLLTQMDGVDSPGFFKKLFRRFVNVSLDGLFIPRTIGGRSVRVPALKPPSYNLFFLGATNRPNVLDPAVTRPGRFGRSITFRNPTRDGRKDIADLYFATKAHDPELDAPHKRDEFARITEGHSPADIEQMLSLALVYAFEDERTSFNWADLRTAIANVESGLAEQVEYSDRDKLGVARHELGHAIAARFFQPDIAVARLSIKMRGGSLGHYYGLNREEEFIKLRSQISGRLRMLLGAMASERVFYGENSGGVSQDLVMATDTATYIVGIYGMGPELGLDGALARKASTIGKYLISLSSQVGTVDDGIIQKQGAAVAQVLGAAYIDAWRLMYVNKAQIDEATKGLIAAGELVGDEVDALLDSVSLLPPPALSDADVPYPDDVEPLWKEPTDGAR